MNPYISTFPTPFGNFSVAVDEGGSVTAAAFGKANRLLGRSDSCHAVRDHDRTSAAREQLVAYLAGKRRDFSLRLAPSGTPFQQRVWNELKSIPFGQTRSYGEIAKKLKSSARAVGRAVGMNPLCPIVPCHRVIGADGSLTGFAFGLKLKAALLKLEQK
jgi:methylated-DNA-[protein]-cysteine S-methyltransferase